MKKKANFGGFFEQAGNVLGNAGINPLNVGLGVIGAIHSNHLRKQAEQQQASARNLAVQQRDAAQSRALSESFNFTGDKQFTFDQAAMGGKIKKSYAKGGKVKKTNINGPKHEQGGKDIQVNQKTVEAEGGEVRVDMPDGSVVILSDRIGPDDQTTYAQLGKAASSQEDLIGIASAQAADPRAENNQPVAQHGGFHPPNQLALNQTSPSQQNQDFFFPQSNFNINPPSVTVTAGGGGSANTPVPLPDSTPFTANNQLTNLGSNPLAINNLINSSANPPTGITQSTKTKDVRLPDNSPEFGAAFLDNIGNFLLTQNTPELPQPVLTRQPHLRDTVDTSAAINDVDEGVRSSRLQGRNLRGGGAGQAQVQAATAAGIGAKNKIRSQQINQETDLRNRNSLIRTRLADQNNQVINDFNNNVFNRDQAIRQQLSGNLANLSQDIMQIRRDKNLFNLEATKFDILSRQYNKGLLDRNLPVEEIATQLGFGNEDHELVRAFFRRNRK